MSKNGNVTLLLHVPIAHNTYYIIILIYPN